MTNLSTTLDYNIKKRIRLQGMITTNPGPLDKNHLNGASLLVIPVPSNVVIKDAPKSS